MARLTFGVPVFNGEQYLAESLESILSQTFADFELIIGDNASTDRTMEICERFAARDGRIRILKSDSNKGAAWNYNRLVEHARGEHFKWHAHDDLIAPEFAARCIERLEAYSEEILCYPQTQVIDDQGLPISAEYGDALTVTGGSPASRLSGYFASSYLNRSCNAVLGVIRTSALRQTRLIGSYASSDKILLAELALLGGFHQLQDALFFRRAHGESSVAQRPDPSLRDQWFDSSKQHQRKFVHWKWFMEYIRAIHHVPLALGDRVRADLVMIQYWRLYRIRLKGELRDFLLG